MRRLMRRALTDEVKARCWSMGVGVIFELSGPHDLGRNPDPFRPEVLMI